MNELAKGTNDEIPRRAVEEAVEAESRRRRRVFRIYLALLIIPIIAAGAAAAWGRSEREVMAPQVKARILPEVKQEVADQIRPEVDRIVAERSAPVISRLVAQQVAPAVAQQVLLTNRNVTALQTEVASVRARVEEIDVRGMPAQPLPPQLREIPELSTLARGTARDVEQQRGDIQSLEQEQRRVSAAVEQAVAKQGRELAALRQEIEALKREIGRPSCDRGVERSGAAEEALSLARQQTRELAAARRDIENLKREVAKIRELLRSRPSRPPVIE